MAGEVLHALERHSSEDEARDVGVTQDVRRHLRADRHPDRRVLRRGAAQRPVRRSAAHRNRAQQALQAAVGDRPAVLPADDRKRAQIAAAALLLPGTLGGEPFGKLRRDGDGARRGIAFELIADLRLRVLRPAAGAADDDVRRGVRLEHTIPQKAADLLPAQPGEQAEADEPLGAQPGDGREQLLLLPFCQRFFLGRLFPARLERARRILADDVGVRGGGEDLLQRLHRVALAAAAKVRARGHDVGDAVRRHLRHAQRADDRQNDRVNLPRIMLAHLLGQARLPAGEPRRGVLPHERIRGDLFLRRPARAKLRDGEIALGDRPAVDVVVLPVRALDALPV